MTSQTYAQWKARIDRLDKKSNISRAQLRLDRIQAALKVLGNPQWSYQTVHVGGTAGKGSTCSFLASIFRASGMRTGLTFSPYVETVREKLQVDGVEISQKDFVRIARQISDAQERAGVTLSYFEFILAMAFQYFRDQRVDVAVVEVGVGGRYDATNVLKPAAVIVTNVGNDHIELLGGTPEAILHEKMGIIKPGVALITGVARHAQQRRIATAARRDRIPWMQIDRDFRVSHVRLTRSGARFDLVSRLATIRDLAIQLPGTFQPTNAALAIMVASFLRTQGWAITRKDIRHGCRTAWIPYRFQVVDRHPLMIFDAAHSPEKIRELVRSLKQCYPRKTFDALCAIRKGKDAKSMLHLLLPAVRRIILTPMKEKTSWSPADLIARLPRRDRHRFTVARDAKTALAEARAKLGPQEGMLVTGSMYLLRELCHRP
jgi:dihydrofolate synthase/folylpolyglutamate synthase